MARNKAIKEQNLYQNLQERYEEMNDFLSRGFYLHRSA